MKGIPKKFLLRHISSLQPQIFLKRGCQVYAFFILDPAKRKGPSLEYYKLLWDYTNIVPNEVPRLPPKREIDFTIDLMLGAVQVSKVPYQMST